MTKDTVRALRAQINAALASVGDQHGLAIHAGNAVFDPNLGSVRFKLEALPKSPAGHSVARLRALALSDDDLDLMHGFKHADLGATVMLSGRAFVLDGIDTNRREKTVVLTADGKTFSTHPAAIRAALQSSRAYETR